MEAKGKDLL